MAKKNYVVNQSTESAASSEAAKEAIKARSAFAAGLAETDAVETAGLKRLGMPTLIKPGELPINQPIVAEFIDALPSPAKSVKGNIVHFRAKGTDFCLGVTGVIGNALCPGVEKGPLQLEKLQEYKGKTLTIIRRPDGNSKNHTDEYGNQKRMFMFDVFVNPETTGKKSARA